MTNQFNQYLKQLIFTMILILITTLVGHQFFGILSTTSVTILYLLVVVTAAYFCYLAVALCTAFIAFAAINYFFVVPRYTFEVAHIESWASLISFLIVSLIITSLVKRLKSQTLLANVSSERAVFAKKLAEHLALADDVNALLSQACDLLETEFNLRFNVALINKGDFYTSDLNIDQKALNWAGINGKSVGPHTDNWPELPYWLIPFNRLPSKHPVIIVTSVNDNEINTIMKLSSVETFTVIKSCVDQVSQAYQRIINNERAKIAELSAQEEAIQSALLVSISHDMRTPLTSILGAATTLQQNTPALNNVQTAHLTALIASQARYLATTTENILSLIRLESNTTKQISEIPMDWQSPEELIGVVVALYKDRGESINIQANITAPELLIKANANLITQAMLNLIDNAKQANIDNKPIEIEVSKSEDFVNISVKDYGTGFDSEFTSEQIKKFSTTRTKGFGLGLSIVQAIAKAHDAKLTITQRNGHRLTTGACVTLSFKALNCKALDIET